MSFTRASIVDSIIAPVKRIQDETLCDNDLKNMLKHLNALMIISEKLVVTAPDPFEVMWNEIVSDAVAIIHEAISGFYHTSQMSLRSILEIACSSFFYYDHSIEYHIFSSEGREADTYVSKLVNEYEFFKTSYIRAFYPMINSVQSEKDSVALFLKRIYKKLCDVVHGRYDTFTKIDQLEIKYSKSEYIKFENKFSEVISIIAIMYSLRFSNNDEESIREIANEIGVVKL